MRLRFIVQRVSRQFREKASSFGEAFFHGCDIAFPISLAEIIDGFVRILGDQSAGLSDVPILQTFHDKGELLFGTSLGLDFSAHLASWRRP